MRRRIAALLVALACIIAPTSAFAVVDGGLASAEGVAAQAVAHGSADASHRAVEGMSAAGVVLQAGTADSTASAPKLTSFKPATIASGCVRVVVENGTWAKAAGAPWAGQLLDEQVKLDAKADTIRSLIDKALVQKKLPASEGASNYISGINGISEKENGADSGWMITLNDWFINESADAFAAKDSEVRAGDEIRVMYTANRGADVGSDFSIQSKALASIAVDAGTLASASASGANSFTLTLPKGTKTVHVRALALNQEFQVRTYLGAVDASKAGYRSNDAISVVDGSVINVVSGDDAWETSSTSEEAAQAYAITVRIEGESGSGGKAAAKEAADKKAASKVASRIAKLPAAANVTDANAKAVKAARTAYKKLTADQKKLVSATSLKKLKAAEAAVASTITINAAKVTKASFAKAVKKAGKKLAAVKKIVLGKKVKTIGKSAFSKAKKATVLVVKTKKLKKSTVKKCLSGSKVKTVKVAVGSAKANKSYAKKYKKLFVKKVAGRKATVKA